MTKATVEDRAQWPRGWPPASIKRARREFFKTMKAGTPLEAIDAAHKRYRDRLTRTDEQPMPPDKWMRSNLPHSIGAQGGRVRGKFPNSPRH